MTWLLSQDKWACNMQCLSLHDHLACGQNSDVEHFDGKKCGVIWRTVFSTSCIITTDEWKAVFTSIQIKLVVIILIPTGLVARSNYSKWEFKRCTTGRFNSQMAWLRISYAGKAPVRLERKLFLSTSTSASSQKWWSLANISIFYVLEKWQIWMEIFWVGLLHGTSMQCLQIL